MRIAAQTDENEQLDICTSFTGKLLDCRHRLSSVPCIEQPETKNMRTAVKVKTVTVVVFTVFNINIAYKNTFTVQESCSPSCRIIQSQIMQADISTIQKSNHHRTVYVVAVRKNSALPFIIPLPHNSILSAFSANIKQRSSSGSFR